MPQVRWQDLYCELESSIMEELDYRQEAASIRRMRKTLRSHKIYAPKVYLELCTDQVLVMEMVQGVYMSEYIQVAATNPERARAWLKENQISARKAGERLLSSHYRQLFEDNLYHCDLHPGNILLMRNSRITLIDFGSVGSSDQTTLTKFLHLFRAVAARDYQKAADLWLLLSPSLPAKDLTQAKAQIVQMYREFESLSSIKSLPYHQKSAGKVAGGIIKGAGDAGIAMGWDLLRFTRAELTLDASLMFLLPGIDYPRTIRTYLRQMRKRTQQKFQSSKLARAQLAKLSEAVDMPAKLAENAYFEGEYLRRRAMKYEGFLTKGAQVSRQLFVLVSRGLVLASLAAGLAALHQKFDALRALRGTWAYSLLERIPRHGPVVWLIGMVAGLYVSREFFQITHILEQAEPSRAGGERR
jgi:ubiquinone biosynthesis protein